MRPRSRIYTQSYNSIVTLLRTELAVGDRLPVQMELARRFNASQGTISSVVQALRKAGLIGKGTAGQVVLKKPLKEHFLPQVQDISRREGVEQGVVEMLLSGKLKPGTYFSELALARHFNVTTGTVREAMLHLSRLGVFTKSARKQWQFAKLGREELDELMDVRVLIETYSLRRYFQRHKWEDDRFAELLRQMEEIGRVGASLLSATQVDWDLHRAILEAGGNRRLFEHFQFASFTTQLQWLHYRDKRTREGMSDVSINEHIALLKAIMARNESEALALLEHHLQTARHDLHRTL